MMGKPIGPKDGVTAIVIPTAGSDSDNGSGSDRWKVQVGSAG